MLPEILVKLMVDNHIIRKEEEDYYFNNQTVNANATERIKQLNTSGQQFVTYSLTMNSSCTAFGKTYYQANGAF